jgi:hypothetical protein
LFVFLKPQQPPENSPVFLAFTPQFMRPEAVSVALPFFVYGLMTNAVLTLVEKWQLPCFLARWGLCC